MTANYHKYVLEFKKPSGTSRGVLLTKETWFIVLENDGKIGIGECGILRGLSVDDRDDYEEKLKWTCDNIHLGVAELWNQLIEFPSIQFGIETAFKSLEAENLFELFPSEFQKGDKNIPINGLVWMGTSEEMKLQIEEKIEAGFSCIKLKIGAIDFDKEVELLAYIRSHFTPEMMEIRVDANGGFTANEALSKLEIISGYQIHSIEQPIQIRQYDTMTELAKLSKIPIALDEELIGIFSIVEKEELLTRIRPQFIILKPSLVGGFKGSMQWIEIAEKLNIGWWITSALESNIGLNAIAQWTYCLESKMPQGLGTGSLYTNNFDSPLVVKNGALWYDKSIAWEVPEWMTDEEDK